VNWVVAEKKIDKEESRIIDDNHETYRSISQLLVVGLAAATT
jgi:hypothetical protein